MEWNLQYILISFWTEPRARRLDEEKMQCFGANNKLEVWIAWKFTYFEQ